MGRSGRLVAPLGVAPPAVRTAILRMVGKGWLEPVALSGGRRYQATARCTRRLEDALTGVYRLGMPAGMAAGTCW